MERWIRDIANISGAVVLICALLGSTPILAGPIATGQQTAEVNGTRMTVFTYRPAGCSDPSLIAHSAGGQFLSRLAAFVPSEAKRIVLANAGTYVFPSLAVDAPYGLGKVYSGADGEAQLRRYLEQPLTIYLGEDDVERDDRNNTAEARAQGASRHQSGMNMFDAGRKLAQARGWTF